MVMHDIIFVFFKGEEVPSCDFLSWMKKDAEEKMIKLTFLS